MSQNKFEVRYRLFLIEYNKPKLWDGEHYHSLYFHTLCHFKNIRPPQRMDLCYSMKHFDPDRYSPVTVSSARCLDKACFEACRIRLVENWVDLLGRV